MAVILEGFMVIYGPKSSGKTTFGVTAGNSKKTTLLDGDSSKGKWLSKQMGINYVNLSALGHDMTEIEYFGMFLEQVDKIPKGQEVIVVDNPSRMFLGAHSYVLDNEKLFRKHWTTYGPIKGPQQWQVVNKVLLPQVYTKLLDKARLVIVCAHEKKQRDDAGVLTGAMEYDVSESAIIAAGMSIRLTKNFRVPSPAPVGLVVKHPTYPPKNGKIVRFFPDRISPLDWRTMKDYISSPFSLKEAEESEKPDESEYALIEGGLNPEQQRVYALNRTLAELKLEEAMQEAIKDEFTKVNAPNEPLRINMVFSNLESAYPAITKEMIQDVLDKMKEVATSS